MAKRGWRARDPGQYPSTPPVHQPGFAQVLPQAREEALAAYQLGDWPQAERLCRLIIREKPNSFDALFVLGVIAAQTRRLDEAADLLDRAITVNRRDAAAHYNRGLVLQDLGRLDESLASYDRAIRLRPDFSEAHNNRGNVLSALKRLQEAVANYDRAVKLRPGFAQAHNNRGMVLQRLGRLDEALVDYDRAIRLMPEYAEAHDNRGTVLQQMSRFEDALASYEHAVRIKPDYAGAHWNLALCCLLMGDLDRGWEEYEWGWASNKRGVDNCHLAPDWEGEPVGSLLVLREQGVGDEIFYAGMLNDVRSRAEAVTVCVDHRLVALYQRSFDNLTVSTERCLRSDVRFDAQVYLGTLGRYVRRGAAWTARVPYLTPSPERVRAIRAQLERGRAFICGLSWLSKNPDVGVSKTLRLSDFGPIFELSGIEFVDLQYGDTSKEQLSLHEATGHKLTRVAEIDAFNDLDGLAALICACDVVVTVSNATAHLAAALGKPTLVLLPHAEGLSWCWHVDRDDSPWYPTASLFRQEQPGAWNEPLLRVRERLLQMVDGRAR